ncbi:hypothetical protein CTEN210_17224 [Chaetoceros tenuissimus]|uniref:PDEase domain-containing protein n=1 Tax=Chaetoceros tenuissimus TaxID=426638 RepID=A0AAD3DAE9_9STRA|nr:hypothetical protein CTEN210_17224 [Chaetoceros tenuissimus]
MSNSQNRNNIVAHQEIWCGKEVVLIDAVHGEDSKIHGNRENESNMNEEKFDDVRILEQKRDTSQTVKESQDFMYPCTVCPTWLRPIDGKTTVIPSIQEIKSWDFDVLIYNEEVLVPVCEKMLEYYDLYQKFNIDKVVMNDFIVNVWKNHESLPYHNWYHAVGTMNTIFNFLTLAGAEAYATDLEIFVMLIGGLAHDTQHPGQNNEYHIKIGSERAKRFQDISIHENHSINWTIELWERPIDHDHILSGLTADDRSYFLDYFRRVILYTDPSVHGELSKRLIQIINEKVNNGAEAFDRNIKEDRILLGECLLHASDISNPAHGDFETAKDWCQRIATEFREQVFLEKQRGVTVTGYMDGLDTELAVVKMQIGFCNFMALPFFQLVGKVLPRSKVLEENIIRNTKGYEERMKVILFPSSEK